MEQEIHQDNKIWQCKHSITFLSQNLKIMASIISIFVWKTYCQQNQCHGSECNHPNDSRKFSHCLEHSNDLELMANHFELTVFYNH